MFAFLGVHLNPKAINVHLVRCSPHTGHWSLLPVGLCKHVQEDFRDSAAWSLEREAIKPKQFLPKVSPAAPQRQQILKETWIEKWSRHPPISSRKYSRSPITQDFSKVTAEKLQQRKRKGWRRQISTSTRLRVKTAAQAKVGESGKGEVKEPEEQFQSDTERLIKLTLNWWSMTPSVQL